MRLEDPLLQENQKQQLRFARVVLNVLPQNHPGSESSPWFPPTCPKPYLEGQGDLVSGLIMGIIRVTIWVIGVINLLTKSP